MTAPRTRAQNTRSRSKPGLSAAGLAGWASPVPGAVAGRSCGSGGPCWPPVRADNAVDSSSCPGFGRRRGKGTVAGLMGSATAATGGGDGAIIGSAARSGKAVVRGATGGEGMLRTAAKSLVAAAGDGAAVGSAAGSGNSDRCKVCGGTVALGAAVW